MVASTSLVSQPSENVAIIPFQASGGIIYKGLLSGRPDDSVILGAAYGKFSRDFARSIVLTPQDQLADYEAVFELSYRIQLTKFFAVSPDLQWINHPAGTTEFKDALVAGLRINVTF